MTTPGTITSREYAYMLGAGCGLEVARFDIACSDIASLAAIGSAQVRLHVQPHKAAAASVSSDAERKLDESLDLILWDLETTLHGLDTWALYRAWPQTLKRDVPEQDWTLAEIDP